MLHVAFNRNKPPLPLLLLLPLVVASTVNTHDIVFNEPRINASMKCCDGDKAFLVPISPASVECRNVTTNVRIVGAASADFPYNCMDEVCVDFVYENRRPHLTRFDNCSRTERIGEYISYPKCCPLGKRYVAAQKSCVTVEEYVDEFTDIQIFSFGLPNCLSPNVIRDYTNITYKINNGILTFDEHRFEYGDYCIDVEYATSASVARVCQHADDVCKTRASDARPRCLRKCCQDGYSYLGTRCEATFSGLDLGQLDYRIDNSNDPNYAIMKISSCRKYIANESHILHVDAIGNQIYFTGMLEKTVSAKNAFYCIENYAANQFAKPNMTFFVCETGDTAFEIEKYVISSVFLAFSCVCIVVTIICYLIVPECQNLYGKCIIAFSSSLFCLFIMVLINIWMVHIKYFSVTCHVIALTTHFANLASFTWWSIICYDMWMAFGTIKIIEISNKHKDCKKFIYYNLYGWGLPLFFTTCTFILTHTGILDDKYKPQMINCIYDARYLNNFFIALLPMSTLMVANTILFIRTIVYCFKVKNEIARIKTTSSSEQNERKLSLSAEREKLFIFGKLFFVMGVSWLFEVFSSLVAYIIIAEKPYAILAIEYAWDFVNSLQGFFIFVIFILKRKMFEMLKSVLCGRTTILSINEQRDRSKPTLVSTVSNNTRKSIN